MIYLLKLKIENMLVKYANEINIPFYILEPSQNTVLTKKGIYQFLVCEIGEL